MPDERQPDDEPLVKGHPPTRSEDTREFSEKGYFLATTEGPSGVTLDPKQDAPSPPPPPPPTGGSNDDGGSGGGDRNE